MTLPSTGKITASMINEELGHDPKHPINLNDFYVRQLSAKEIRFTFTIGSAGKLVASEDVSQRVISFDDFHGKTAIPTIMYDETTRVDSLKEWIDKAHPGMWDAGGRLNITYGSHHHGPIIMNDVFTGSLYIIITRAATVAGIGGEGGYYSSTDPSHNGKGKDGGNAIEVNAPMRVHIQNDGIIAGGGGGGGAGGYGGQGGYHYSRNLFEEFSASTTTPTRITEPYVGFRFDEQYQWIREKTSAYDRLRGIWTPIQGDPDYDEQTKVFFEQMNLSIPPNSYDVTTSERTYTFTRGPEFEHYVTEPDTTSLFGAAVPRKEVWIWGITRSFDTEPYLGLTSYPIHGASGGQGAAGGKGRGAFHFHTSKTIDRKPPVDGLSESFQGKKGKQGDGGRGGDSGGGGEYGEPGIRGSTGLSGYADDDSRGFIGSSGFPGGKPGLSVLNFGRVYYNGTGKLIGKRA